jgi:hypothetical protein
MRLTNAKEAIKQVFGKGYFPGRFEIPLNSEYGYWIDDDGCHFSIQDVEEKPCVTFTQVCLDPLFWQALGKARGWLKEASVFPKFSGAWKMEQERNQKMWKIYALDYFETRLSGGDERKFWESVP